MKTGRMKNWQKIVAVLKAGPDFAIHGTKHENIDSMLRRNWEGKIVFGHRFSVSEEERKMPDEEFYNRLVASVHEAVRYSTIGSGVINGGLYIFSGLPCIALGIDEKSKGTLAHKPHIDYENPRSSNVLWLAEDRHKTFRIGHDFVGVKLKEIIIPQAELNEINERLRKHIEQKNLMTELYWKMSVETYVSRQMSESIISKIHQRLKAYS